MTTHYEIVSGLMADGWVKCRIVNVSVHDDNCDDRVTNEMLTEMPLFRAVVMQHQDDYWVLKDEDGKIFACDDRQNPWGV